VLHPECERIFRVGKTADGAPGRSLLLHKHQEDAILIAKRRESYVLTTGTGSGKSLSYFIPIIDDVLCRRASGASKGISAIVVYPMNALCNSQMDEQKVRSPAGMPSVGRFRSRMTLSGQSAAKFAVMHNGARDVVGYGRRPRGAPPAGFSRATSRLTCRSYSQPDSTS
jgi:hypothetical protein